MGGMRSRGRPCGAERHLRRLRHTLENPPRGQDVIENLTGVAHFLLKKNTQQERNVAICFCLFFPVSPIRGLGARHRLSTDTRRAGCSFGLCDRLIIASLR